MTHPLVVESTALAAMVDAHDKLHPERDRALRTAVGARRTHLLVKGRPERV